MMQPAPRRTGSTSETGGEDLPQSGFEQLDPQRLDEVSREARRLGAASIFDRVPTCEGDQNDVLSFRQRLQLGRRLQAAQAGHAQIEQDHLRAELGHRLHRRGSVVDDARLVAQRAEQAAEAYRPVPIVVGNQDPQRTHFEPPTRWPDAGESAAIIRYDYSLGPTIPARIPHRNESNPPMINEVELTARLALAIGAGAILGWEREAHNKPAGVKTHMLVALGSAGFMLAGMELHEQLIGLNQANNSDLMKVLGGIVGGIGFLGAGSIIQSGRTVHGLTTAATIWLAAAVGIACSLGLYTLAAASVGLALATLLILGLMQRHFSTSPDHHAPPDQRPDADG